jgi:uncharacterized protein
LSTWLAAPPESIHSLGPATTPLPPPRRRRHPLLLISLVLAIATGACQRFKPQPKSSSKPRNEPERRDLVARFKDVIASTGGSQVWVRTASNTHRAPGPNSCLQVLAASSVFRTVHSALQQESERNKLEIRGAPVSVQGAARSSGGTLQVIELSITRHGQPILRIRMREVPRILRAAIVIDDLGQDREPARQLLRLPYPLTFSVLPHLRYSQTTAEDAHHAQREVMLHLPMEPEPGMHPSPGEGEVRTGMRNGEVRRVVDGDLNAVPFAQGVNNHMGSRATQSGPLMVEVMKVLAEHHLYFIDSRTTAASVALEAARRQGVPAFYRAVFLDDTETVSYTLGQLHQFRRVVEKEGVALAIGHPHSTTITALAKFLPELDPADIQLVGASELVRLPEIAHLKPTVKPRL